ncbi:MAG TPA: hypothetical protein PKC19_07265 [Roseiflexaceae bacterium]|nr:hypothetical protein [Roseiflexaceae bacterium]
MTSIALQIDAAMPIAAKVAALQQFLGEHYVHANGMMYSHWYWGADALRPFRPEDFAGQSVPQTRAGFSAAGYSSSENSPWVSGIFLWSQCLRYRATGDEQALAYAATAFHSLDTIFALAEAAGEPGFLCKPYDWQLSQETSPDQYIAATLGMWAYREIAGRDVRQRIDAMLPAMADWWRERDYTIAYFERRFRILDDAYHAPTMACLHALAYQITADRRYLDEARRLLTLAGPWQTRIDLERARMLAELRGETGRAFDIATAQSNRDLGDAVYDAERAPFVVRNTENRAAMWMMVAAAEGLFPCDLSMSGLLQQAIARYFDHCRLGLRPDLLSHYFIQVDLERNTWYPILRPLTPERRAWAEQSGHSLFVGYDSAICWGDAAARIADIALIGHLRAPALCPGALTLARDLLARLDNQRLHWFVDPDGQQWIPELHWMRDSISSDAPAFATLVYWRGRANGIEW